MCVFRVICACIFRELSPHVIQRLEPYSQNFKTLFQNLQYLISTVLLVVTRIAMLLVIDEWMIMCSGQTPCLPLLLTWTWITLALLLLDDNQIAEMLPKLELDAVCLSV